MKKEKSKYLKCKKGDQVCYLKQWFEVGYIVKNLHGHKSHDEIHMLDIHGNHIGFTYRFEIEKVKEGKK
jgi:hypothetical protein